MEKSELVASVAKKTNVDEATAEKVVNAVIAEAVSPAIFRKGGQVAGIGDTNGCRIPASVLEQQVSSPAAQPQSGKVFGELTSDVQRGRAVKVIVQGTEYSE